MVLAREEKVRRGKRWRKRRRIGEKRRRWYEAAEVETEEDHQETNSNRIQMPRSTDREKPKMISNYKESKRGRVRGREKGAKKEEVVKLLKLLSSFL